MKSRMQISRELKSIDGFLLVKETASYDRFNGPLSKGSLYVKNNYISATDEYKVLENTVPRSSTDSKGCPEWRDTNVNDVLSAIKIL